MSNEKKEYIVQKGYVLIEFISDDEQEKKTDAGIILSGSVSAKLSQERGYYMYRIVNINPDTVADMKVGDVAYLPIGSPIGAIPMKLDDKKVALVSELDIPMVSRGE